MIELFSRRSEAVPLPQDAFRLSVLLTPETRIIVSDTIFTDLSVFLSAMETEQIDLEQLGIRNQTKEKVLRKIAAVYIRKPSE